jgi:catechol 2,3-dioxygenase-like lactoylglutathione lyase family enzyme
MLACVRIEALDHVALWVDDRDVVADFLTRELGVHVIDRTEAFTLIGADARRGKLTLFAAEGEREPGVLAHIGLRVRDLAGTSDELDAPGGLRIRLVAGETDVDYDLDHVAFRVRDPDRTSRELADLGFVADGRRLRAGDSFVVFEQGDPEDHGRPLLNHLGLRVASAEEHIAEAERRGLEIADVVDAPNTYAVFVWGPDRIKLEYIEHKASFSLA